MGGYFQTTKTDAGWNYNVGKSAWNLDVLAYKEIAQLPTPIQNSFISDMAQNRHRKDEIERFIQYNYYNNLKLKILEQKVLTWLSPVVLKALKEENIDVKTPIATLPSTKIYHALRPTKTEGQLLSKPQYLRIYDYVNNSDKVFIDKKEKKLLYVFFLAEKDIIDGRDCIIIPLKLNQARPTPNFAANAEMVKYKDALSDKNRYKKIE